MTPEISVIIPTYKRPEKLANALASVGQACSLSHEIIVVDDCPDGSAFPVASLFKAQYLCKSGKNRGLSQSRNIGIALAKGKYLLFLDDDDLLAPRAIDTLHQAISDGVSFAFGDYTSVFAREKKLTDLSLVTYDHLLICNQIPVGSYLIERCSIHRNFDERMRSHEDWEFLLYNLEWSRCKHIAVEIVSIDKTENSESSMQARRRQYFWLDYISIYSRYPAPHLRTLRKQMLLGLGINVDEKLLAQGDVI